MLLHYVQRAARAVQVLRTFRMSREHIRRFGRKPAMVIVGARGGVASVARLLAKRRLLDVLGFEPDEAECERLRRLQPYARFEALALGPKTGPHVFYVTRHVECSSCLEPNDEVLRRYPISQCFEVIKTIEVELHRFDELYPRPEDARADFIQIDVQGFETKVLEGFGHRLKDVVGVQSEAHLRPLYKGQGLLGDLRDLLDAQGLPLRHVRPEGGFEGEVVEAEVWFTRRAEELDEERRSLARIWESMCFIPPADHFPMQLAGA